MKDVIAELFETAYSDLRSYIMRILRSEESTDEIVQEAFLRAHQNLDRMETPRAFLFTTAYHLALDLKRHEEKIKFEQLDDFDEKLSEEGLLEDAFINLEESEILGQAVLRLPPKRRAIFTQRVFFGKSYRELAVEFHISEKTVENHIASALKEVTEILRTKYPQLKLPKTLSIYHKGAYHADSNSKAK